MVSDEFGPAGRSGGHQCHREIARVDIAVAGHVIQSQEEPQERPSTKCPAEVSNTLLPQRRIGDHDRDASGFARGKGHDDLRGIGGVPHRRPRAGGQQCRCRARRSRPSSAR